jgi:hypothetical protein
LSDPDSGRQIASAEEPSTIGTDVPCASCGYNLRGLKADSKCPECAALIANSLRGDLLEFCDPVWVGRLALGARLICLAGWGCLALVVSLLFTLSPVLLLLVYSVTWCLFVVGNWLLTGSDPGKIVLRVGLWLGWPARTVVAAAIVEDALLLASRFWLGDVPGYLVLLRAGTAVAWVPIFCSYLQHLGPRLGQGSRQRVVRESAQCRKTSYIWIVIIVVAVVAFRVDRSDTLGLIPAVGLVSFLVSIVLAIALFTKMAEMMAFASKGFRRASEAARRNSGGAGRDS